MIKKLVYFTNNPTAEAIYQPVRLHDQPKIGVMLKAKEKEEN